MSERQDPAVIDPSDIQLIKKQAKIKLKELPRIHTIKHAHDSLFLFGKYNTVIKINSKGELFAIKIANQQS